MRYVARIAGKSVRIDLDPRKGLLVDGTLYAPDIVAVGADVWSVIVDGRSHEVAVLERSPLRVRVDGHDQDVQVVDEREQEAATRAGETGAGSLEVRAPMPGLIVAVHVGEGDEIGEGASVCTLEAMKMENELTVPRRGRVTALRASSGTKVNAGDLLAVIAFE